MNIFDYDIDRIAKNLITTARVYECNYLEAWDLHTPMEIKSKATFEEVMHYMTNTFF